MKRILAILLICIFTLTFGACGNKAEKLSVADTTETTVQTTETTATPTEAITTQATESADTTDYFDEKNQDVTPLLYKVSDDEGNFVWVLGSIHVAKEYFYPLPDYILDAYENADYLAVECDIKAFETDLSAQTQALTPLMYLDGTRISDYLSTETYEKGKEVLTEYGLYASYMDMMKPVMWYSMIDSALIEKCGADSDLGIDYYFLNQAYENNKEILEVESVQFQYEMLANYSEELQALLLEEVIYYHENFDLYKGDVETMLDLWCRGDDELFADYLSAETEFESAEAEELYNEFNKAMITDRNIGMADFAEEMIDEGKEVFICVGAAHVVGEGAMADLLSQRGYNVEIIR